MWSPRALPEPLRGAVTEESQKRLGLNGPLTGVLFDSGRLNAADKPIVPLAPAPDTVVETELGYVIAENIATQVANDTQARECVQSIVPVIELPQNYSRRMGRVSTAKDMVASNIGSTRFIVGTPSKPPLDADAIKVSLKHDGKVLHESSGANVKGGQWSNLRLLLNQITAHGQTVRAGSIIICGALGGAKPGEPGTYIADYGDLGTIQFELK